MTVADMCGTSSRKKRYADDYSEEDHEWTLSRRRVKRRGEELGLTEEQVARYSPLVPLLLLCRRSYGVQLGYQCGLARLFEEGETGQLYQQRWIECNWNKTWTPWDYLDGCKWVLHCDNTLKLVKNILYRGQILIK